MNKIQKFIYENKEYKQQYGSKAYYKLIARMLYYFIGNPLIMLFFAIKHWWVMVGLWIPVTVYGWMILFYGKDIMQILQEWQMKRMMKNMMKENKK